MPCKSSVAGSNDKMSFLTLPRRTPKPRHYGLTSVHDISMTVGELQHILADQHEFVDIAKLGIGTAYITPRLREKIALYQESGVEVHFGGTLFEKFYHFASVDDYKRYMEQMGVHWCEISSGTLDIPLDERVQLVKNLSQNFVVIAEVGNKDEQHVMPAEQWIQEIHALLEAGCRYVVTEGRASGNAGIYHPNGEVKSDLIEEILRTVDPRQIIFEAPVPKMQATFTKQVGANVNLGNVALRDLLFVESLRNGLWSETFFLHDPVRHTIPANTPTPKPARQEIKMQSLEQTLPELFLAASSRYLGTEEAIHTIHQQSGILPVAITQEHQVVWLDVGDYPFREWKFRYSIQNLVDRSGIGECFTTDIRLLTEQDSVLTSSLQPAGFIFHMSKCGSTLMSKCLAQPEQNLAISEGTPFHENLWSYLTNDWQQAVELNGHNLSLLRNLILALGRRRIPKQQHYFIKFRSWNITFVEAIQKAFPEVPCLFMYRDPAEVLVSSLHKSTTGQTRLKASAAASFITGYTTAELESMDDLQYFTGLYQEHLRLGATAMQGNVHYLNYQQMTRQNLSAILQQSFGYTTTSDNLELMQAQFNVYSKDDSGKTHFTSDNKEKQRLISSDIREAADQHLMPWYQQLENHPANLAHTLTGK